MNQEYILLAGWLWKLLGKKIYLWRNHYAGSWLTDLAAAFCTKVFCTSKHSYTTKYKKTMLMPVGVDTERFKPDARVARAPHSILFLARMAPSKRPEMLIDALASLARNGIDFSAALVGSPLPRDAAYYEGIKQKVVSLGLANQTSFMPEVPNSAAPDLYRAHEVFVNCSPSGMFDKTLFEAAACGCRVLASSKDFALLAGADSYFESSADLAQRLRDALAALPLAAVPAYVEQNSLTALGEKLTKTL
jgi:glycosyltransferase involved in cell wall biosynthesis